MTNSDNRQPLSGRVDDSRPARPDWSGIGAGITFLALAALALYAGWDLPPTRASAMGPGTFPYVLTVLLGVLGAIVLIEGVLCRCSNVGGVAIVPTIVVFAAAIAFTLVIKPFGFIAAGSLTAAVVGLYGLRTQLGILVLVLFISLAAVFIASALFDVPIQWWPAVGTR